MSPAGKSLISPQRKQSSLLWRQSQTQNFAPHFRFSPSVSGSLQVFIPRKWPNPKSNLALFPPPSRCEFSTLGLNHCHHVEVFVNGVESDSVLAPEPQRIQRRRRSWRAPSGIYSISGWMFIHEFLSCYVWKLCFDRLLIIFLFLWPDLFSRNSIDLTHFAVFWLSLASFWLDYALFILMDGKDSVLFYSREN